MTEVYPTPEYCYNHPTVETSLHCNRCGRPICPRCAVLTPTGYRCKECVRGQQKTFETADTIDYPLAFIVAAGLGFAGSIVASFLGFFTIFIAPIAGMIISEAVRLVIHRRRSKRLFQLATAATAIGALPLILIRVLPILLVGSGGFSLFGLLPLLYQGIYMVLVASTVYYRLAGIQMRY